MTAFSYFDNSTCLYPKEIQQSFLWVLRVIYNHPETLLRERERFLFLIVLKTVSSPLNQPPCWVPALRWAGWHASPSPSGPLRRADAALRKNADSPSQSTFPSPHHPAEKKHKHHHHSNLCITDITIQGLIVWGTALAIQSMPFLCEYTVCRQW